MELVSYEKYSNKNDVKIRLNKVPILHPSFSENKFYSNNEIPYSLNRKSLTDFVNNETESLN
jgi:hypothetical protein